MSEAAELQDNAKREVSKLLGLYKAEWLNGQLFELFAEPQYLEELRIKRPCVLIGGRGTGKTTVLRGLSYLGQFAIANSDTASIPSWSYFGLYYRVNTTRVAAFRGPELTAQQWIRAFAHYMNLVFCGLVLEFVDWYQRNTSTDIALDGTTLLRVQESLHLPACGTLAELGKQIDLAQVRFEAAINNVVDAPPTNLSMQSAPLDALTEGLMRLPQFAGKQFFILLDEYENFEDYQQQVVNTFIKQARPEYTFKVGVRELGWRERATLNVNERLTHPADYARVNIREKFDIKTFREFAARICNDRLKRAASAIAGATIAVQCAFPSLSEEQEADLLGVSEAIQKTLSDIRSAGTPGDLAFAESLTPTELHLIRFWSESGHGTVVDLLRSRKQDPTSWRNRYNNYLFSSLFTIRRRKRGIRKYYAGWDVMTQLSDGNIRFLLELVHQSYLRHFEDGGRLDEPISPANQTESAQLVGKAGLSELEGVSVEGGRLTKLLLSLGRIFQVLAESPEGHTPEATHFYLDDPDDVRSPSAPRSDVNELLKLAVMHQALVRTAGNKLLDEFDTKEYDYQIHPIFAPFFCFSYRHKRKLKITTAQLLGLVTQPRDAIREVLERNNRALDDDANDLPDQLRLFEGFYHGDS